jgi:micrococcal nuclease
VGLNHRRGLVAAVVLAAFCAGCAGTNDDAAESSEQGNRATVERVVDGDTLVLTDDTRVRLIGIDTPETVDPRRPVECFGQEASDHAKELLPKGTEVRLVFDVERTDRYGRTLAYVYRASDDLFVNLDLVRNGYAEQLTVPPNVAHADDFAAAVDEAREAENGLWGDAACVSP